MAQNNEQRKTVEIEKHILPQKAVKDEVAHRNSTKGNATTEKGNTQDEFNSEWLVINNLPESNVIITENDTPDEAYEVENTQSTKSETETSKLINMVEEYQNNYFTVQNNQEQTNVPSLTNTAPSLTTGEQLIAMADNSNTMQSKIKGPMKATGTGADEDPFNTGVGNDNNTTYNDNNVMGSLPIGDGNIFLFLLIAISTCIKFARNHRASII